MKFEDVTVALGPPGALNSDREQTLTDASILSAFVAHHVSRLFISLSKQAHALHKGLVKPGRSFLLEENWFGFW